jgi:hypothetical protein
MSLNQSVKFSKSLSVTLGQHRPHPLDTVASRVGDLAVKAIVKIDSRLAAQVRERSSARGIKAVINVL